MGVFASPIFESPVFGGKAAGIGGNDAYTKLLLQFPGADGSTTFTDSSASAHTVTSTGTVEVDTGILIIGQPTGLFGGGRLVTDSSTDFALSTGDWTFDTQFRVTSIAPAYQFLLDLGTGKPSIALHGNKLYYSTSNVADRITGSTTIAINTPYHVGVERSGSSIKMYLGGAQEGSTYTTSEDFGASAITMTIGAQTSGSYALGGSFAQFRLSKGVARDPAAWPPTQAYS